MPELSPDIPTALGQLESFVKQLPASQRKELEPMLAPLRNVREYAAHSDEMRAANETLEAHRAEYDALMQDEPALLRRVNALFDEETFVPFRFSAADVHRAFESVGYPATAMSAKKSMRHLEKAALFLATKDLRHSLSTRLMLLVPQYVTQARYMDGWILQHNAVRTLEEPDALNGFLWIMFLHGLKTWEDRRNQAEVDIIRKAGIDVEALRAMDIADAQKWVQAQLSDPAKKAAIETLVTQNTEFSKATAANLRSMEDAAVRMLEREDADDLLLSWDELESWMSVLQERFMKSLEKNKASVTDKDDAKMRKIVSKLIYGMVDEMAPAIFTPQRIEALRTQLDEYRRKLLDSGEQETALTAQGALFLLHSEINPAESIFLRAVCFASLRLAMDEIADEDPGKA